MKNLISKFVKLDNVNKFGAIFGLTIFIPLLTVLIIDIINNGARML